MATIRRWYILVVCAVSLQAVTWAVIAFARDRVSPSVGANLSTSASALELAVIGVGLLVYLPHWLWASRLARRDEVERDASLRYVYLYGMAGGFLGPALYSADEALHFVLSQWLNEREPYSSYYAMNAALVPRALVTLAILAALWLYHMWLTRRSAKPEGAALVRRLYVFAFSGLGLYLAGSSSAGAIRWLLYQAGAKSDSGWLSWPLSTLLVGLPLWLGFWGRAARLLADPAERESALRKFYLYAAVFSVVLATVLNASLLLAGGLRELLRLYSLGNWRDPVSTLLVAGALWAYHAFVLQGDARRTAEAPRQASIRRLYLYLIAAVGLGSFLIGLAFVVSVLIRMLGQSSGLTVDLKETLAWSLAALVAGLAVWVPPWRTVQKAARPAGAESAVERASLARKLYLYLYLLVAILTLLGSAIYVVYRLLSIVLGLPQYGSLVTDLAQVLAFGGIAAGLWLYHWQFLRGDGRTAERERQARVTGLRVAVLDAGDGRLGHDLLDGLRREWPAMALTPVGLTPEARAAMAAPDDLVAELSELAQAGMIIGPWAMAVPGAAGGAVTPEIAAAVAASPARKLLIPTAESQWNWVGVESGTVDGLVRQTVQAVGQVLCGETLHPVHAFGSGAQVAAIIVGGLIALQVLSFLFTLATSYMR
jgi:hypothetical protein